MIDKSFYTEVMVETAMKIECAAATDVGVVRTNNEDAFITDLERKIFIIADGMGGHNGGEVAATLTVEKVHELLAKGESLKKAIFLTNELIHTKSVEDENLLGMGTTLVVLLLEKEKAFYAHVGDSRLYLFRNSTLRQLTEDHSLISELKHLGVVKSNNTSGLNHVLTQAIGTHQKVEASFSDLSLESGDLLLLATDGLTNFVKDPDLERVLLMQKNLEIAVKELIALAKKNGGGDNITLILVSINGLPRQ